MDDILWQKVMAPGVASGEHPHVEAAALGGSHATEAADPSSDIDLYERVGATPGMWPRS